MDLINACPYCSRHFRAAPAGAIVTNMHSHRARVQTACIKRNCRLYGSTRKGTLLESVPLGVTTCTVPVVASIGTAVEIAAPAELTVNSAAVP